MLLEARIDGKPFSRKELRDEVNTFMFEGHDTTSSALCFALFLIATHPEVQRPVSFAIEQTIKPNKRNPLPQGADSGAISVWLPSEPQIFSGAREIHPRKVRKLESKIRSTRNVGNFIQNRPQVQAGASKARAQNPAGRRNDFNFQKRSEDCIGETIDID
ncbi:hypothetical protein D910_04465 [Dendroctonus ponderosae]|uniref:Cytochrome P450 n=1 Tax=Dendroctonus ponderosae TaxID=77166 RepID=U4TZL8_DENPD|nr:hypothetical protein D910_04465 [Dendroctonus ponderosae]